MAENKKSFILYADMIHTVRKMPTDKIGELFLTILAYVNDENPVTEDLLVEVAFEPIKQQLKRDLKRWEEYREKQSLNGKKGGRPKKSHDKEVNPKNPTLLNESQKSLNVNVNVNDTVNVIESKERAPDLKNSNLFRQPTVPTREQVEMCFLLNGGTLEMAKNFYDKHSSVEWFLNGSPIKNFASLVPKFIQNWKSYESNKPTTTTDTARPGSYRSAI